jgi:cytochrome P450
VHFLGNLLSALHRHPDELAMLAGDLSLVPMAIEEGARYDTAGQAFARSATRDLVVGGVPVPEGGRVLLLYGSANRDEALTERPEVYAIRRKPVRHLGFGSGAHFCLGAPLARYVVKIAVEELLPVIGTDFAPDYATASRPINITTRGFDRLRIEF